MWLVYGLLVITKKSENSDFFGARVSFFFLSRVVYEDYNTWVGFTYFVSLVCELLHKNMVYLSFMCDLRIITQMGATAHTNNYYEFPRYKKIKMKKEIR